LSRAPTKDNFVKSDWCDGTRVVGRIPPQTKLQTSKNSKKFRNSAPVQYKVPINLGFPAGRPYSEIIEHFSLEVYNNLPF
jgi:hypothetical protein